ncbi:alpha-ketoglutarate-dependent dioxygenase AlkB family protein [Psychrobacter urativorans]|uniref:DNA repair protein n=1 Tax=Psychrobacter urativorans TaxID=45610 RepID=A0A0M3V901_9GAMM|nr:alpha-ketoglutarate-dependent dioxygenase AlkB [Psychrobacter urativorans]ALF59787.1 DNA repair protein [Psychrobacter urativorans]
MTDLFSPAPMDNILPYDGQVHDLGLVIDYPSPLFYNLVTELPWQADVVTLCGKTHTTTRQIVWMGDEGIDYRYAGHVRQTIPWTNTILSIKQHVEQQLSDIGIEASFNSCLLNYYPSGDDGMGYHADDEPELGAQPLIASLSLGATRKFVFKHKKTQDKVALNLESGQLIVMRGDTQTFWKHSIPKTKKVTEGRISLTFRRILTL